MARLTITLNDSLQRALREKAARENRSVSSIIEESLLLRGIRKQLTARELVLKARDRSRLESHEAISLAVEETRGARQR